MPEISSTQRRELRAKAHHLNPVVSIAGKGLTTSVLKEIDLALKAHELIKIRVYGDDREARVGFLAEVCSKLQCEAIQIIGKLLVVFRFNPELHTPPAAPAKPARRKTAASPSAFELRPGRPTTHNAPRNALSGAPEPRYRKPMAGSGRPRKSAR